MFDEINPVDQEAGLVPTMPSPFSPGLWTPTDGCNCVLCAQAREKLDKTDGSKLTLAVAPTKPTWEIPTMEEFVMEKEYKKPDWLAISEPGVPLKKGDYCVGNLQAGENYSTTGTGSFILVVSVYRDNEMKDTFIGKMIDDMGRVSGPFNLHISCFNRIPNKAVKEYVLQNAALAEKIETRQFRVGDYMELKEDFKTPVRGDYACGIVTIPMGTELIADGPASTKVANGEFGKYDVKDFCVPSVKCYLPTMDMVLMIPTHLCVPYKSRMGEKIVLPDGHWDRMKALTRRILDPEAHKFVYEKLGLRKLCYKGRGLIIMLYGPPGTGKTMTAEYLSESLGKPLIRLQLGGLFDPEAIREKLVRGFQLATKYKAVLLLDEVDVFIRKRGVNPVLDSNTAEFLRVLEHFEGILVMTTNLATHIDEAVFSRAHVVLGYDEQGPDERKQIWNALLTDEVKSSIIGTPESIEAMVAQLAEIKLNGREIKTVVQNAITRAFALFVKPGENLDKIPVGKTRWISPKHFIEEATRLKEQRDDLRGGTTLP